MAGAAGVPDHLVHGMGKALEAPTWPIITAFEAEAILAQFPDTGRFEGLSWHSPRPFSAAALARTDRGEFVLKRHHQHVRSPAALDDEHAFMAHLASAGLSVPEVLSTRQRTSAIAHDGWTYELHRKAAGADLYAERPSWTPYLIHDHAFAAGTALARLHLAARGFAGAERRPCPLVASFTIVPAHDPLAAAQAYIEARPAVARYLADKPWQADLERLFMTLGQGVPAMLEGRAPLWTHNDWHPSNLLWGDDGSVRTIFDFGLATRTCVVHDLATAIERTAIPWLDLRRPDHELAVDIEAAGRLLDGYRTVLPLSHDDRQAVLCLLPLVHIEFALSEVDYFAGIINDRAQADLAWQGYAINHAEWFLSAAGQRSLQQLRCRIEL